MTEKEISSLIRAATLARSRAYAPYSKFMVGAALLSADGSVFPGCNVENISFGLTMCAERVAIGAAVASGATTFSAIAIVSDSVTPVMPCGACRQVLAQFNPELSVISSTLGAVRQEVRLDILLPNAGQGILERST